MQRAGGALRPAARRLYTVANLYATAEDRSG
jgi:hypothetical protein